MCVGHGLKDPSGRRQRSEEADRLGESRAVEDWEGGRGRRIHQSWGQQSRAGRRQFWSRVHPAPKESTPGGPCSEEATKGPRSQDDREVSQLQEKSSRPSVWTLMSPRLMAGVEQTGSTEDPKS